MTSSLSPRTFRPAEHHASRMPGVLSATAVLLTLCLSACGGGGSGSSAPDNQGSSKGTTPPLSVNPSQPSQPDTGKNSGDGNGRDSGNQASGSQAGSNGAEGQNSTGNSASNGNADNPGKGGSGGSDNSPVKPGSDNADKGSQGGEQKEDDPGNGHAGGNGTGSGGDGHAVGGNAGDGGNAADKPGGADNGNVEPTPGNGGNAGKEGTDNSGNAPVKPDNGNTNNGGNAEGSKNPGNDTGSGNNQPGNGGGSGSDSAGNGSAGASSGNAGGGGNPVTPPDAQMPPTSPPVVNKASVSDLCKTTLTGFTALTAGQDKGAMPNTPRPAMGVATEDPTYHSCITRLTDNAEKHPAQPLRAGDGTRLAPNAQQAFNANDSAFLLRTQNGEWHIYSPQTGKAIRRLTRIAGDAEPQWDPKDPNVLYYMNGDGEGMKLFKLTIDLSSTGTDNAEQVADFGAEISKIWPTATHARMRGGAPSFDGNTWCLMADQKNGDNWKTLGLFTWNLKEGKLVGKLENPYASPEYVTTSPSGSHCVAQYPYSQGITAYRSNFATPYSDSVASQGLQIAQNVYMKYPDVARNSKGEDVYVGFDVFSIPHTVYTVNLTSGKSDKTTLLETGFGDNTDVGVQISGRASNKPGWILLTTFGEQDQGVHNLKGDNAKRRWFHRKLFAMNIDTKEVLSIANDHHDWTEDSSQNKTWPRPNGTVNRDFTRMLFDSNWNSMNANDVDAYLVEIPSGAVPAAAGASQ